MPYEYYVTNKHYRTLDYYLKTKYGKKVFKIPLNASFTCPNRDGTKGVGGCAFCSSKGSGDFAGNPQKHLLDQFLEVKEKMNHKWKDGYYIVYFQAYSNTYGSVEQLKQCFEPFLAVENVIGLSIATRCDCLSDEIIAYLKELRSHFQEFWVEMGLQTTNSQIAKQMNLGYTFSDFSKASKKLHHAGIQVVAHIIDGLPNEREEDMIQTIKRINTLPLFGLKIHCLNVLEDSKLGVLYKQSPFKTLQKEEFVRIAILQLRHLKEEIIIHRLGADSANEKLLAPDWVNKKFSLMDQIDQKMEKEDYFQGDLYEK